MSKIKELDMVERSLAIVLLDIIGSTAFVQKVGAKKAAVWFQYHDRLARSLVYRYNGREIDRSDGFLLSFDTIIDAVNFSLHYQREVPTKTHLNTRIGIHWGEVIEVRQEDKFTEVGAKRVELEGISKNIAARTMSLSGAGQVLLTKEAMVRVRKRGKNSHSPANTRFVCVGLYKFKGVREAQEIYAVGVDIKTLQPPKGSEKVKRLGGPKKVQSRARDRKVKEWVSFLFWRAGVIASVLWVIFIISIAFNPHQRWVLGLDRKEPILDFISDLFSQAKKDLSFKEEKNDRRENK